MGIQPESKEQLKESVDIVDIISDHVELKKAGANFKGCCPFHGEKTPSFVVSESKQIYHCFGCGVGGDVFKFLQEFNKMSFVEAVEDVAGRVNFTLQYDSNHGSVKDFSRVLDTVSAYYVSEIRDSDREYLKSRGLTAKTVKAWQIGWAGRSPEQKKFFDSSLLPMDEILELGLLRTGERGTYAQFTERIMFPICNHMGKIVGFSGRSLKAEIKAKYLNSIDSAVFNKSRILFGYDKAKEHVYKKKFLIIVEGQLDVILLHQVGVQTAVATQGTALTEQHLPQLRKGEPKIVLAYDGDKAGRAAAYKGAWLLSMNGFDGGVVLFPEGQDPASMIAEGREDEVKRLLTSWTDMIRFVLKELVAMHNVRSAHGKNDALKECVKYLNALPSELIAQEYVGYVSELLGVGMQHVQLGGRVQALPEVQMGVASMEQVLLYSMYENKRLVDVAIDIADDEVWQEQKCYRALLENKSTPEMFASVLLQTDVQVLSESQFKDAVRIKQKSYLKSLKSKLQAGSAGFDEIQKVNDRIGRL